MTMRLAQRVAVSSILLFTMSGCVSESISGNTHTYTFALWVPLLALVIGVVAVPAGMFLSKISGYGGLLLVAGPLIVIFGVPTYFMAKLEIDDQKISVNDGIVFFREERLAKFEDVSGVRYQVETSRGRRGRVNRSYYFFFDKKDGSFVKISATDILIEKAIPVLLVTLQDKGIPLVDQTNGN